jgi:hypothetical protein
MTTLCALEILLYIQADFPEIKYQHEHVIIVSFSGYKLLGLDERTALMLLFFILASCDKKLQSYGGSTTDNWCYIKVRSICQVSTSTVWRVRPEASALSPP